MDSFFVSSSKSKGSNRSVGKPHRPNGAHVARNGSRTVAQRSNKRMRQTHSDADDSASKRRSGRKSAHDDDDADSDPEQTIDDLDLSASDADSNASGDAADDAEQRETPAQKRLRLAKRYLEKVREEVDDVDEDEIDAEAMDRDLIAERLRDDVLESTGRAFHKIAEKYAFIDAVSATRTFRARNAGQQLSVTGVTFVAPSSAPSSAISNSRPPMYIYSVSKDACIVKWDFWTGRKLHAWNGNLKPTKRLKSRSPKLAAPNGPGHNDIILAVASSHDGRFLVTGGMDSTIQVWCTQTNAHLHTFRHHRNPVTSLSFDPAKNHLYTASRDRTIKLYNIDDMGYIETLFGHQDDVTCVSAGMRDRCVSSGSRDRTVRLWKIPEESQLVFRAGGGSSISVTEDLVVMDDLVKRDAKRIQQESRYCGSVDVVAMIDHDHFVSGNDIGDVSLWHVLKKKPVFTKHRAHGYDTRCIMNGAEFVNTDLATPESCSWITSLAAVQYSDLFASGSCDGVVKLWKLSDTKCSFSLVNSIVVMGFINSMVFFEAPVVKTNSDDDQEKEIVTSSKSVLHLAVGVGQEHRLGRWYRNKDSHNQVVVVGLLPTTNEM